MSKLLNPLLLTDGPAAAPAGADIVTVAVGPIEARAMSAAALRIFTDRCVTPQKALMEQAAADATAFLQTQIAALRPQLEIAKSSTGCGGPAGRKAAMAKVARLRRKLQQCEADLKQRQAGKHSEMTTRDVHRLIIKPATDALVCRYVELAEWADGTDASERPLVGHASYFVSHSWDTSWYELVSAIETHKKQHDGDSQFYYWVDIFAVCQHWRTDDASAGSPGNMPNACDVECPGCLRVAEDMHDWETARCLGDCVSPG